MINDETRIDTETPTEVIVTPPPSPATERPRVSWLPTLLVACSCFSAEPVSAGISTTTRIRPLS